METNTSDHVVGVACIEAGRVLVTCDKDFKSTSKRLELTKRQYLTKLHCVLLRCDETKAKARIVDALSLIEAEFSMAHASAPMKIEIFDGFIRVNR